MKKWLLKITKKPKNKNFFLKLFSKFIGTKPMLSIIIMEGVEAETLEEAIQKTEHDPNEWDIVGMEIKKFGSNPEGAYYII